MRMIDIDEGMPLIKAIKGWARTEDERKLMQIVINTLEAAKTVDANPVKHGTWRTVGSSMIINLENAREQYKELGYPHRTEISEKCSICKMVTSVDDSIKYDFCPHCGARMDGEDG